MKYIIRKLDCNDINKNYINLISQLSSIDDNVSYDEFVDFISELPKNHHIYVIEMDNIIVGTATLFIEPKIIHNFGYVGHIEDVVISKNYRKNGFGKIMMKYLINEAKRNNCYKIILNCAKENISFYEKCGFSQKNYELSYYFNLSSHI